MNITITILFFVGLLSGCSLPGVHVIDDSKYPIHPSDVGIESVKLVYNYK